MGRAAAAVSVTRYRLEDVARWHDTVGLFPVVADSTAAVATVADL